MRIATCSAVFRLCSSFKVLIFYELSRLRHLRVFQTLGAGVEALASESEARRNGGQVCHAHDALMSVNSFQCLVAPK